MGRRNVGVGKDTIGGIAMRYIQKGKAPESLIQYAKNIAHKDVTDDEADAICIGQGFLKNV